jgi:uncharacterized protein (DUF305 family)
MSESDPRAGVGLPAPTAPADATVGPRGQVDEPSRPGAVDAPGVPGDDAHRDGPGRDEAVEDEAVEDEAFEDEALEDVGAAPPAATGRRRRWSALWWTPVVLVLVAGLLAAGAALRDVAGGSPGESSVDVGFARDMSEHHAQAVQMAMIEFNRGADPTSRSVAQDIALTQQREIGVMSAWLSGWGRAQTTSGAPMRWMGGTGDTSDGGMSDMPGMVGTAAATLARPGPADDTARMPGMATPAQLRRLASSNGHDLDVQFLTLMIHHHRGGLAMAQYAAEHAEQDRTRSLARAMVLNQSIEIDQMQQDLVRLGAPRA